MPSRSTATPKPPCRGPFEVRFQHDSMGVHADGSLKIRPYSVSDARKSSHVKHSPDKVVHRLACSVPLCRNRAIVVVQAAFARALPSTTQAVRFTFHLNDRLVDGQPRQGHRRFRAKLGFAKLVHQTAFSVFFAECVVSCLRLGTTVFG